MRISILTTISLSALVSVLSGCGSTTLVEPTFERDVLSETPSTIPSTLRSHYEYQLASATAAPLSVKALSQQLQDSDVILVGEWHSHSAIHRFQTDLFIQLMSMNRNLALSMEQFSRPAQTTINQYLAGEIGEQMMIENAHAWPNYESDYRALIEVAKSNQRAVIASNAPKDVVQCIAKQGIDYLDRLPTEERKQVANDIDTSNSQYKQKFMASMHHGTPESTEKQYAAQITWDETMAESIVAYLDQNPESQVMHIAGKFHTEDGLGIAHSIKKRNPAITVSIITPVESLRHEGSDYQLLVLPIPTRYVQIENEIEAYLSLNGRNAELTCPY